MKLTIYVPDSLSQRLDTVKQAINVSEVCQSALERAVTGAEAVRLGDERSRILARLRVARSPEQRAHAAGQGEGMHWAAETAALDEIERVLGWETISLTEPPSRDRGWAVGWMTTKLPGTAVVFSNLTSLEYEPVYFAVPSSFEPVTARALTRVAPYWNGFRDGVARVYELIKGDLGATPPDPDAPTDSGAPS